MWQSWTRPLASTSRNVPHVALGSRWRLGFLLPLWNMRKRWTDTLTLHSAQRPIAARSTQASPLRDASHDAQSLSCLDVSSLQIAYVLEPKLFQDPRCHVASQSHLAINYRWLLGI